MSAISLAELQNLNHGQWQEFFLNVGDDAVYFQKLLRLLPGKRLVAEASWGNKTVVAKLFFGTRAKRKFAAEICLRRNFT